MNDTDTLIKHIDSWTQDILSRQDKLQAWVDSTESTQLAHKNALLDELFGEEK